MTQLREVPPVGGYKPNTQLSKTDTPPKLRLVPEPTDATRHKLGEAVLAPHEQQDDGTKRQGLFEQIQIKLQTIDSWKNLLGGTRLEITNCQRELREIDEAVQDTGSLRPIGEIKAVKELMARYEAEEQNCLEMIAVLEEEVLALRVVTEQLDEKSLNHHF